MGFYLTVGAIIGISAWLIFKYKKKIAQFFKWFFDNHLMPELKTDISAAKKSSIENLVYASAFSDKIFLRSYSPKEDKDSPGFGIYYLNTGRKCCGVEVMVPTNPDETYARNIVAMLQSMDVKDLVIQIKTIGSKDINGYFESVRKAGPCKTSLPNNSILKKIQDDRIAKMKCWTGEKSASNARWYARDFRSFILLSFSEDTPEEKIRQCYNKLLSSVSNSFGLHPEELMKIYSELLKGDVSEAGYDKHQMLNRQLCKGAEIGIEGESDTDEGFISIGKNYYAKVLTTDKFPIHTNLQEVQNALFPLKGTSQYPMPGTFQVSLTLHFEDLKKLRDRIKNKANANIMAVEKTKAKKKDWDAFVATNPKIGKIYEESKNIVEFVDDGEFLAEGFYSITVYDKSKSNLNKSVESIKKAFSNIKYGGWEISDEKNALVALMCFISELPFNWEETTKKWLNRYNLLFTSNMIAILPLIGSFKGIGQAVLKFLGRPGQVVGIDLFAGGTNYNCNIIGASGTGKSFLTNSIVLAYLQNGTKVTIFDIGRSYKSLCDAVGGEFLVFSKEKKICLNFFTKIQTEFRTPSEGLENLEFINTSVPINEVLNEKGQYEVISDKECEACVSIICLMANIDPEKDELSVIVVTNALQYTFVKKGRNAGLEDFATALKDLATDANNNGRQDVVTRCDNIESALLNYSKPQGLYYDYFNGANNIDVDSPLFVIETEEIAGTPLYNVIFMSMLISVAQQFYFDRSQRKIVIFDESAPLLKHKLIAPYLEDFSRRLRKYNAAMITATQGPKDYDANPSARAVWANAAVNLILPIKEVASHFSQGGFFENYDDYKKTLLECVTSNPPHYSELTAVIEGKADNIRLKVTPLEYTLFTSKADDINQRKEYKNKYGLTDNQAVMFAAYVIEKELSESEILKKVIEGDSSEQNKMWVKNISSAIRDNEVYPFYQPICDRNGNVNTIELFCKIRTFSKMLNPDTSELEEVINMAGMPQFINVAIERGLYYKLHNIMIERAIEHCKANNIQSFSINLHNKEISGRYLDYYKKTFDKFEGMIILEINAGFLKDKNADAIKEFISSIQKIENIACVVSDVDLNTNLEYLNLIKPIAIKVSGEFIRSIVDNADPAERKKLDIFKGMGEAFGFKVIAMHIEHQKSYDICRELGFDLFQGVLFGGVEPLIEIGKKEEVKVA